MYEVHYARYALLCPGLLYYRVFTFDFMHGSITDTLPCLLYIRQGTQLHKLSWAQSKNRLFGSRSSHQIIQYLWSSIPQCTVYLTAGSSTWRLLFCPHLLACSEPGLFPAVCHMGVSRVLYCCILYTVYIYIMYI